MVWLVLGPMLYLFIEHGGAELLRLLSGDVDDFKANLMMLFGAWHTQINDAKDHSIFIFFH
jgi:hypothetical protein